MDIRNFQTAAPTPAQGSSSAAKNLYKECGHYISFSHASALLLGGAVSGLILAHNAGNQILSQDFKITALALTAATAALVGGARHKLKNIKTTEGTKDLWDQCKKRVFVSQAAFFSSPCASLVGFAQALQAKDMNHAVTLALFSAGLTLTSLYIGLHQGHAIDAKLRGLTRPTNG